MKNIYDFTLNNLEDYLLSINDKKYRAKQIYEWLYIHKATNFKQMTNISTDLINKLENNLSFSMPTIQDVQKSLLTNKYLFKLSDGNFIEAVLMHHDYGISVCVSSEVGCNMNCSFCESGRLKMVRKLETSEMVTQIILIEKDINKRIDSVVIMGIGEPFDNYDNVMNFIYIINNPFGLAIGARHITVSTCGIIPKIEEFSNVSLQVNLAVSLHAPNDELRSKLMPINNVYPLNQLIDTLRNYIVKTNRRVTIEYVMLNNVNDDECYAHELAKLLKGLNIYVNLIPYNETGHLLYQKSSKNKIDRFYDILMKNRIQVTIRREFGSEIDAACGQLRAKEVEK